MGSGMAPRGQRSCHSAPMLHPPARNARGCDVRSTAMPDWRPNPRICESRPAHRTRRRPPQAQERVRVVREASRGLAPPKRCRPDRRKAPPISPPQERFVSPLSPFPREESFSSPEDEQTWCLLSSIPDRAVKPSGPYDRKATPRQWRLCLRFSDFKGLDLSPGQEQSNSCIRVSSHL